MDDRIPPFLTVEEAGRLLKIGRTKAYDLTKEWRATGGRSGLPVVDLGDVLRVPGPAIEQMLGIGLGAPHPTVLEPTRKHSSPAVPDPAIPGDTPASPQEPPPPAPEESPAPRAADADGPRPAPFVATARPARQRRRPTNQLPLFQALIPTEPHTPSPSGPRTTPIP